MNYCKSIVFFLVLFCLFTFLLGFRYGSYIKKINQTYVPPTPIITPTEILSPTPTETPVAFKTYSHKACRLSFLLPSPFETKESSLSGSIKYKKQKISLSCDQGEISSIYLTLKQKDPHSKYKNVSIYKDNKNIVWFIDNPLKSQKIMFLSPLNLIPIIIDTIEFKK